MGIRGAIAQDQVLALFGTTADAFKSTDFYTYSTILTAVSYTHLDVYKRQALTPVFQDTH